MKMKNKKIKKLKKFTISSSKIVEKRNIISFLEEAIRPGNKVCIEGCNQKQADFLAKALCDVSPSKVRNIHIIQSAVVLPEHLDIFEKGIASKLDFAFSGPQAKRLYKLVSERKIKIGSIHTYVELYARYFSDLKPDVALVVADFADRYGNLYTGYNTEDTPVIAEATSFGGGIVIAQVKKVLDKLPRVDIPGDWIDFVIPTEENYYIKPLFTRDPAKITNLQIFLGMLLIKGIYEKYKVESVNHGVGYNACAVELILPTFGKHLKGKVCKYWALNPHPTLIPAIEEGFVKRIFPFGGEPGMEDYVNAHPEIFPIGNDGSMRSNRVFAQLLGLYGIDCFVGSTLQIDKFGNSSTAINGMISGFGGAPNLGSTPPGRRHSSFAWNKVLRENKRSRKEVRIKRGRKLVIQMTPTRSEKKNIPVFVEELDAFSLYRSGYFEQPPVMIYGDEITHIITEKGIANFLRCSNLKERMLAVSAVAGDTEVGKRISPEEIEKLRKKGIYIPPEDLGLNFKDATRDLLAAKNFEELVHWSKGLYKVPKEFL
ncbi:MAG: malonate decarboxylase subunit alpha [Caldiserica bacterium]|nr:MAG: malonate decarboxylase subunit alpha [Caldisericota bacterium]